MGPGEKFEKHRKAYRTVRTPTKRTHNKNHLIFQLSLLFTSHYDLNRLYLIGYIHQFFFFCVNSVQKVEKISLHVHFSTMARFF